MASEETMVKENVYYNISYLISRLIENSEFSDELITIINNSAFSDNTPIVSEAEDEKNKVYPVEKILEYWLVSEELGSYLKKEGQYVFEFCDMIVWGRTISGQVLWMDRVIKKIAKEHWTFNLYKGFSFK